MPDEDQLFQSLEPLPPGTDQESGMGEPLAPAGVPVTARFRPTPHRSKLQELSENSKLPPADLPRVRQALSRYETWIHEMASLEVTGDAKIQSLVVLLNDYKRSLEMDLVWDSEQDFLFRQRGQLKVDNSVMEEFLPWLVDPDIIPALTGIDCFAGPASAFAAAYFQTTIGSPLGSLGSLGLRVRTKDQDFTLSRRAYIRASFDPLLQETASDQEALWLAYFAAECKTNLDKTMFQSAVADAHDLKIAMPGSQYFLICEYLDMTPISSSGTDIDEVLVLRGKRLASNKRARYSTSAGRKLHRDEYLDYLDDTPVRLEVVERFVGHIDALINHVDPDEDDAVTRGYF